MGALRTKIAQDLLVRGLSPLTQEAYIRAVVGLTKYYGRAPDTLRERNRTPGAKVTAPRAGEQ